MKINRTDYKLQNFIIKANLIHNNKYDYSNVIYINTKTKIKIFCIEHGMFEQELMSHLKGCGCPSCKNVKKLTTNEFIKKANITHNNKYNYKNTNYINTLTDVNITCPEHGDFEQKASNHLNGNGCPTCGFISGGSKIKSNTETFINKANIIHNKTYDYSLVNYINVRTKIKILCTIHGIFEQLPSNHLSGSGCYKCGNLSIATFKSKSNNDFIIDAKIKHNDEYDYSLVNYIDAKTKIKIICKKHVEFEQLPSNHLSGSGCPICNESKGEKEIRCFLIKNEIKFIRQKTFSDCKNINLLSFDFYLPDSNTCIEFNGRQHYEPINKWGGIPQYEKQIINDKIKMKYCRDNNIPLIIIKYDDNILNMLKDL